MKNRLLAIGAAMLLATGASAAVITYEAALSGAYEVPPTPSTGTGFATVTVDTTTNLMNVKVSFTGLIGTTTASHIHCCTATVASGNAGVATAVPTFPGFPLGVTAGSYNQTFDLTLASSYNPAFITANGGTVASAEAVLLAGLAAGKSYLNIHSTVFPGGEIRGFLTEAILVNNPLFTAVPGSCPILWICGGSPAPGFSSYNPTAAQYPGGSPFPTSAFSPTVYGGSGVIRQLTNVTWTAGVPYVLDLFVGLPLKEPDGTTPVAGWPGTNGAARVYLTMGPGFGQVAAFDIPSPAPGTWGLMPITITLPANSPAIGQSIGIMIFVSAPSGYSADFAIMQGIVPVG
jgi:CHRD domain-containing protein